MVRITLLENLRALFYAPFYVAHGRKLFAQEGVDVALEQSHSPIDTVARAIAGDVDVFQAFQPYVEQAVQAGCRVLAAAADRGPTAYTCFYTRRDNCDTRREALRAMTRALRRSVAAIYADDGAVTAATLAPFFPDLSPALIAACVDRYRSLRIYNPSGELPRAGFERLRQSMLSAGYIANGASFETCVDNSLVAL